MAFFPSPVTISVPVLSLGHQRELGATKALCKYFDEPDAEPIAPGCYPVAEAFRVDGFTVAQRRDKLNAIPTRYWEAQIVEKVPPPDGAKLVQWVALIFFNAEAFAADLASGGGPEKTLWNAILERGTVALQVELSPENVSAVWLTLEPETSHLQIGSASAK